MILPFPSYPGAKEKIISVAILAVMFLVFWLSPVRQVTDSSYSMLLSQSLLEHGTFALDQYALPRLDPSPQGYYTANGTIYQLELIDSRIYYLMPPGSSLLSLPYVAVAKIFGLTTTNQDNSYNQSKEERIESGLAALLMAIFTVLQFWTARLVLPRNSSLILSLGTALGTQVWSTASRAVWTDTWGIVLLSVAVWFLLAQETGKRKISPVFFATLMSWLFFVRPTNSVHIAAITLYLFLFYRELIVRYLITGALWLGLFVAYSWHYYHHLLPSYYQSRLNFGTFGTGLAGNLISPSRGLLVYVPVLFFVAYLLIRYRRSVKFSRLVWLSLTIIASHLFVISSFAHWWGGWSYGSRLSTGLVPWFALLAIVGMHAMQTDSHHKRGRINAWRTAEITIGLALLLASIAINARGATSRATWLWSIGPRPVDRDPSRLWDWREPQFLAGLVNPPLPANIPIVESGRIEFGKADAQKYLWYGWSTSEPDFRWTDGKEATVVFALDRVTDFDLTMKLRGFLEPEIHSQQRVEITLNGHRVQSLVITEDASREYTMRLTENILKEKNVLRFNLPDAVVPSQLRKDPDIRELGIAMYWMEFQSK